MISIMLSSGCQGMRHKQDRHHCRLMVNLKLFLSDVHHWRVHITGSHVPSGTGVKWIPPSLKHCPSASAIFPGLARTVKKKSEYHSNNREPDEIHLTPEVTLHPDNEALLVEKSTDLELVENFVNENNSECYLNMTQGDMSLKPSVHYSNGKHSVGEESIQKSVVCSKTTSEPDLGQVLELNNLHVLSVSDDRACSLADPDKLAQDKSVWPNQDIYCTASSSFRLGTSDHLDTSHEIGLSSEDVVVSLSSSMHSQSIEKKIDMHGSSVQTDCETLILSTPRSSTNCHTAEAPLAHAIPSKKRISKMLSKLKRHRMKRGSLYKMPLTRLSSKSDVKVSVVKPVEESMQTLNIDLNKLLPAFTDSHTANLTLDNSRIPDLRTDGVSSCNGDATVLSNMTQSQSQTHTQPCLYSCQPERSIVFQKSVKVRCNPELSDIMERNFTVPNYLLDAQSLSSTSFVPDSQIMPSYSLSPSNLNANGSCLSTSSLLKPSTCTTHTLAHCQPLQNRHSINPDERTNVMWVEDANDLENSSEESSSKPSAHKQPLNVPLYQSAVYNNQSWRLSEDISNTKNPQSTPESSLPMTTELQQMPFGCPEIVGHGNSILACPTDACQARREHNVNWSGTLQSPFEPLTDNQSSGVFLHSQTSRSGSFECSKEQYPHLDILPTYQEATTFLSTQFDFSN